MKKINDEVDDLDLVVLTPAVVQAWQNLVPQVATMFVALGVTPPLERGRVESDGILYIFVTTPSGGEVGMKVPADQWAWKDAS